MKLLWIGELVKFLVASMKKGVLGNALAMLVVGSSIAWGGSFYVQAKTEANKKKIEDNSALLAKLAEMQYGQTAAQMVMQSTLLNINSNLKDLKDDSRTTKNHVWQILKGK